MKRFLFPGELIIQTDDNLQTGSKIFFSIEKITIVSENVLNENSL